MVKAREAAALLFECALALGYAMRVGAHHAV